MVNYIIIDVLTVAMFVAAGILLTLWQRKKKQ